MPKITTKLDPARLRIPQIEVLRVLQGGAKLTTQQIERKTGLTTSPEDLNLLDLCMVTRTIMWVDGQQEHLWGITDTGKLALKASGMAESTPVASERGSERPKLGTLVPWAGAARLSAEAIGRELEGIPFCCVPFAGGMSELLHIRASTILVNDIHRHIINLARVLAHPIHGPKLIRNLRRYCFHPETLQRAQATAIHFVSDALEHPVAAEAYFISQWMGRNGRSGGPNELKGALALRYSAPGGDSALRYSNAVKGLREWRRILERCSFTCDDWRKVLNKIKDGPKQAIYADPPWPGLGDEMYTHRFTEKDHRELAQVLGSYKQARIVLRYLDCPLAEELYPEGDGWVWRRFLNRNTNNNEVKEVLIVRNGADGDVG